MSGPVIGLQVYVLYDEPNEHAEPTVYGVYADPVSARRAKWALMRDASTRNVRVYSRKHEDDWDVDYHIEAFPLQGKVTLPIWSCYYKVDRYDDTGTELYPSERAAWESVGELVDVSDLTNHQARYFWSLPKRNLQKFIARMRQYLDREEVSVCVEELQLTVGGGGS